MRRAVVVNSLFVSPFLNFRNGFSHFYSLSLSQHDGQFVAAAGILMLAGEQDMYRVNFESKGSWPRFKIAAVKSPL
jgi:hypothetical protein